MANKVKTRFDSALPNKNKVGTLVGINKPEVVYVDFLELKVEKNGIEMPFSKFLEKIHDQLDSLEQGKKKLAEELIKANEKIKLQQEMLDVLDARIKKMEEEGNL